MNGLVITLFMVFVTVLSAEIYTDRYDSINIDEILENRKLLIPYVKCMLDTGRCTPEGKELKQHIQDAMVTGCSKCTDKQKHGARKVVKHMKVKEQEYWEQMKAHYDPENKYKDIYEAFLAAED